MNTQDGGVQFEDKGDHTVIKDFIHKGSVGLKPTELVMEELKVEIPHQKCVSSKYYDDGPSGCGKTMISQGW